MKKVKNQLTEAIDLMSRMNLFEGVTPQRQRVDDSQMIEILNHQDDENAGCYISMMYVVGKKIYSRRGDFRGDEVNAALSNYGPEGNEHWFPQLRQFMDDESSKKFTGISGVIMVTRYVMHWTTKRSYDRAYGKYIDALHNARMKYNPNLIVRDGTLGDTHHSVEKTDVTGNFLVNNKGNLEKQFNVAGNPTSKSEFYVVGEDGSILGSIPQEVVASISAKPSPSKMGGDYLEVEMRDIDDAAKELYLKEKAELTKSFVAKSYLWDRILAIVTTINGVPYYYLNDNINVEVKENSGLFVKADGLHKIAEEKMNIALSEADEFVQTLPTD